MRVLAGRVQRPVARRRVEVAKRDTRFHRIGDQPVVGQVQLDDFMGAGEHAIDHRLVADHPVVAQVAGNAVMHFHGARLDRIRQVRDSRQVRVVDFQQFSSVLRFLLGFGDHYRDRVADMAHLAGGDHRMRRLRHGGAVLAVDLPAAGQAADALGRHVGADKHLHHARGGRRRGDIDPVDGRVRPVRPLDVGIKLAGPIDVVGVVTLAAEKADVFLAADGCADSLEPHGRSSPLPAALIRPLGRASADERRRSPSQCYGNRCSGTDCLPGLRGFPFPSALRDATAPDRWRS